MPRFLQLRRRRKHRRTRNRSPVAERLESRLLLASDWRNPVDALDVNGDSYVSPIDALFVANDLHRNGPRSLPTERGSTAPPFLDVNGDGATAPSDAIRVIDALNAGIYAPYVLEGSEAGIHTSSVLVGLGQEQGLRVYTFDVEAKFDLRGGANDRLEVYLVDPRNPSQTLLDGGQPGTPLFVLEPETPSYADECAPGNVHAR